MVTSPLPKRRSENDAKLVDGTILPPVIVFAHGAGASSSSDWMIRWKKLLQNAMRAVEVVTFDYPYISVGKKRPPPKAENLVQFHKDVVKNTTAKYPRNPLILAGKSMGSRVSCMVAAEPDIDASAVICLGYPLKAMKGALREEPLLQLKVPVIFVQGTRDPLCPLQLLQAVRKKMSSLTQLHVIDDGDHSFKIGKKYLQKNGASFTQNEKEKLAAESIFDLFCSCCVNTVRS